MRRFNQKFSDFTSSFKCSLCSCGLSSYCWFWIHGQEVEILYVFVEPKKRDRGLGTFLIRKILKKFSNFMFITEVEFSNLPSLRMFYKLGFRLNRIRRNYYGGTHGYELKLQNFSGKHLENKRRVLNF